MPVGYLVSVAFVACCSVFALAPLRRSGTLGLLSWWLGQVINELPFCSLLLDSRRYLAGLWPG
jgi:hypothetical protein